MSSRRIKIIIVIAFISVLSSIYYLLPLSKNITIVDGREILQVKTKAATVGDVLAEKRIVLNERDIIEPGLNTILHANMTVQITRAKAVKLIVGGEIQTIETTATRVGEVLQEAGVIPGEWDRVTPDLGDTYNDTIQVVRVERKNIREEKPLAYDIQKVDDNDLYKGEQRIRQKGKSGVERLLYEVVLENGQEVARKMVERIVARKPVSEIVAVGIKQTVSRGGKPLHFKEVKSMVATGYTHTGNQTYTDIWPTVGIVAVDPKVIPLRTRLYIEGYGYATAMDIGSAIKGNRIDLFFETRKEALKWGRRTVQVFVLE